MGRARSGRARRVEPDLTGAVTEPDYAGAFAVLAPGATAWSAEQWIRTTFEDAPRPLRWLVLLGWKAVLRLRLGPSVSPDHVLGWRTRVVTPRSVVLEVHSALLTAHKVLQVDDGQVTLTTFISYERKRARVIWSVVALVHHRLEPLLLTFAASRIPSRPAATEPE